jgi:hypothetical protein
MRRASVLPTNLFSAACREKRLRRVGVPGTL